ncbi:TetR/AcrR family transcriptional regulator [Amycolatopsis vastitatis]|jgi:AcrR family transcriptional regulator|uniref:TetR/AcrR family transcriptional regulator n=1 Tax=Amycolatopsis vastitatis TaxID=1905142 RepID=UPI00196B0DCD|nr:TetR/AcrR family transcriptional regulator [Amycolatopsis vastitatis]
MSDTKREELVLRLERLFLDEGFARLTVDDLASRLQCSKSTLYAVAGSKEQLVVVAVRHFFQGAATRVEEKVGPITDPSQRIAEYLAGLGAELRRMSPECYADLLTFEATAELYARHSLAAAHRVRESIQDGVASGAFRAVNADFVGAAVSLLIDGIQHGELLDRSGLSMADAYTELGALVLAALANPGDK